MRPRSALLLPLLLLPLALASGDEEARGFLPKDDLGVAALRREIPEADGRGVLVAVIDTGVDLLNPALQRTPAGERKVADFTDGTDAGEVATAVRLPPGPEGAIGLSGRRLVLPEGLGGELRLCLLRASELFPRGLLRRLRRERREARERAARLARDRAAGRKAPPPPVDEGDPLADLLLYRRADGWRLRIDTDGDGDLSEETPLREFAVAGEVAVLGEGSRLGVGFRVLREGEAVSLLFDGGGHGTHVAGIIAGNRGEGSPLSGLAPGARLVAAKIGNGRYGGATTHLAMLRALTFAGEVGADVVNISFGGPSLYADGREVSARFIDDAVRRYGYAVCVSAGNAGPAHGTVGSPATARRAFTIGAWCSAATQTSNYGVVEPAGGRLFGFSSLGPLPDGRPGVDFLAPGAAVSSMPEWSLAAGRNMNGTSMAAPQASGAVAVLLSAARREGLPASWPRVARALRRSARPVEGLLVVEQGHGLIDVRGALALLRAEKDLPEPVVWIAEGKRLSPVPAGAPVPVELSLRPDWPRETPPETKARFERLLRVVSDSAWLQAASPVHANAEGATVRARLDPAALPPGLSAGVLSVRDLETGVEVARHVVTAVRPETPGRCGRWLRFHHALRRGDRRSVFLLAPPGATTVRVEARETAVDDGTRIALRTSDRRIEEKGLPLGARDAVAGRTTVLHRAVREGTVLEIVTQRRFRAPAGETEVEIGACFRGVAPGTPVLTIPRGRFGTHLALQAGGRVRGRIEAKLEWREEPLHLAWRTEKDPDAPALLGEETLFRHVGTATFRVPPGKGRLRFDLGFESPLEDYLDDAVYRIEDANGRAVARGHFWRGPFDFRPPHRGRFTLVVTIWERGRRFFRGGAILSPVLLAKLPARSAPVKRDVYDGLLPGGPSGSRLSLRDGERTAVLVTRPKGGESLRGTVRFVDEEWGTDLFSIPLRVEPPSPPEAEEALRAEFQALLAARLEAALDSDEVSGEELSHLAGLVEVARAGNLLTPPGEAGMLLLEARHGDRAAARAALEKLDDPAALRARVEVRCLDGDAKGAEELLARVRGDDEGARRIRFLVARAKGDPKKALAALTAYLKVAPPRPSLLLARFDLLLATGKLPEARRLLSEWTLRLPRAPWSRIREMAGRLEAAEAR